MLAWGFALIVTHHQACLIYNPFAGRIRRSPNALARVEQALAPLAGSWRTLRTSGPGAAGALAAAAVADGVSLVVTLGGDGTINEVIQGLAGSEATLGILPAGTANVLAMETGIGGNMMRAARNLANYEPVEVALGSLCGQGGRPRLFVAMAGAGLDARIVRRVKPEFKRRFGKLSYWVAGFGALGERLPEFAVRVDGREYRASYALFSRVRNYGGDLEIARHADLLRDDLAAVLFEGANSFRYIKYFTGVLLHSLPRMKGVHVLHGREVELTPLNGCAVDLQLDGEYAGLAPARITLAGARVRLLLPRGFVRR
jgi:diacylglycerol kinase (ATP)